MPGQTLDAREEYRRADRLLAQGRAAEVLRVQSRVEPLAAPVSAADHLACASSYLCLGRACAARAADAGSHADDARHHLDTAVDHLRRTGHEPALPAGLLARADFAIERGDLKSAEKDLADALAIAQRSDLRFCETEAMLGFARLSLAAAVAPTVRDQCLIAAAACWQHAAKLITDTGDRRRLAASALIEAEIALARAFPHVNAPLADTLPSPLRGGVGGGGITPHATGQAGPVLDTPPQAPPLNGEADVLNGAVSVEGEAGELDAALAALEAAAEAISDQQQFSLLARFERLAAGRPALIPTLARLAAERSAFDRATDDREQACDEPNQAVRDDEDGDEPPRAGPGLAAQVATVLADPDLRQKTAAMLANSEARAELAQYLQEMNAGSLDALEPEQQLGAMAAFILSRNDDEDDDRDDDEDTVETSDDDASDVPVSGQLAAAVELLLSDAQGREMVDGLLLHPGFRQALITELEDSKVPVPLEQLPRDIQRKFAAAFALEKGVISVGRGDEPET